MKLKICSVCGNSVANLWRSTPKICLSCARPTFQPTSKSKTHIAPISKHRQDALKKYRRLRDKYFLEHPVCQFPDCNSKEITLHHSKGRCGSFLTDKRYFKSLCMKHHRYVEENPTVAVKLQLSFSRLT